VDAVPHEIVSEDELDTRISYHYLPGLEKPLKAALAGVEDLNLLYEKVEPGNRITGAVPVFRFEPREIGSLDLETNETVMDVERKLVGVIVFTTKRFPWEYIPIGEMMGYIGRSLLIFTFFAGILGSIFGMITANSLTKRLSRVSQAAHDWSLGKFSVIIRETKEDEIGQLARDLNRMADQLESLLDRRQEISVLEERNRLARDLHDSVKQQAFAASAQLRGIENTKTPMYITLFANIINVIGNYILITGFGIFPKMGISGAAWATTISKFLSGIIFIFIIFRGKGKLSLNLKYFKFNKEIFNPLWKISYPGAIEQFFIRTSILVSGIIVSKLDIIQEAAFRIILSLESISFMPALGISIATSALVGKALGEKDVNKSLFTGYISLIIGVCWGIFIGLIGLNKSLIAKIFVIQPISPPIKDNNNTVSMLFMNSS